jgi:L-ribulose-5-phosphate 4-epimerase
MTDDRRLLDLQALAHRASLKLNESGLVMGTFGNLSVVDRELGIMVITPSGVAYQALTPAQMVIVSLADGSVRGGQLKPSSDTPTHLELYRAFDFGAIVHTHSEFATLFAQVRQPIRCMGTTHADYFRGEIPVTRPLTEAEIDSAYEANTGLVIVETFRKRQLDAAEIPAVLVANHAPFAWGADAAEAIEHARVLEYVARLEWRGRMVAPDAPTPDRALVDKHFLRKHGPRKYYGQ